METHHVGLLCKSNHIPIPLATLKPYQYIISFIKSSHSHYCNPIETYHFPIVRDSWTLGLVNVPIKHDPTIEDLSIFQQILGPDVQNPPLKGHLPPPVAASPPGSSPATLATWQTPSSQGLPAGSGPAQHVRDRMGSKDHRSVSGNKQTKQTNKHYICVKHVYFMGSV